jgi:hypothetical protein
MKTREKCKRDFENFDGSYCPTCVALALLWAGMAEPEKTVDFVVRMG